MFGLWCNGSTTGFGSVCGGSNPPRTTFKEALLGSPFYLSNLDKGKIVVVRIRLGQRLRRLYRLLFCFVAKKSTISPSRRVTRCGGVG